MLVRRLLAVCSLCRSPAFAVCRLPFARILLRVILIIQLFYIRLVTLCVVNDHST